MAANPNTNASLFLLPNFSELPPSRLQCMQIDLIAEQKTMHTFTNPSVTQNIFLESHACVSHGSLVLILGGHTAEDEEPTDAVHIFDIAAKTWVCGPNMRVKRSGFAWGVIGNRLYIAGGFGGRSVGDLQETEVYDFTTGQWSMVAPMPISVMVGVFFVFGGKLYVRGSVREENLKFTPRYLCYSPDKNEWESANPWLRKVFRDYKATYAKAFVATKDNELYKVEESDELAVASYVEREPSFLVVWRLNKNTLKWDKLWGLLDSECPGNCQCPVLKELRFLTFGEKVIVMMHHDSEDEGDITPMIPEITEVSVLCPSAWSAAIVNG